MIEITSDPAGARIIVNNQIIGRAPMRLAVKVTPQGFCTEYTVIKARFAPGDATLDSPVVETELTPRDKAPAAVVFTLAGAQRKLR
jgi:hypothetical protein